MRLRAAAVLVLTLAAAMRAADAALLTAMQEEMDRAMAGLRLKDQPAPYYIAYTIQDTTSSRLRATLGALLADDTGRGRMLRVEVRVGDYSFDSSRFVSFDREAGLVPIFAQGGASCTLDDNYDALRRQIWITTDAAYKRAVQIYSKKKAAFQNRVNSEPIPDFSKETPSQRVLPTPAPAGPGKPWADAVRQISVVFAQTPEIYSSEVSLSVVQGSRYFLNSEGFKTVMPIRSASLRVVAETQAEDGMTLRDFFTAFGSSPEELPAVSEAAARTKELAATLVALRKAPVGEDYSGPVMLEGQGAAELLAQSFVPLFLSQRPLDSDGSMSMMSRMEPAITPFLTRIGSKVLPDGFSVMDAPSLARYGNAPVPTAYVVDEEGIPAQDVTLVQGGKLLTLLCTRTPQKDHRQSNGHARGGTAQASVFLVKSSPGLPAARLKEKYLELLRRQNKPFGYIIRGLANPAALQSSSVDSADMMLMAMMMSGAGGARMGPQILRAVKVTPDGKEEPVRGLYLGSVPHTAFRTILEASQEQTLYSYHSGATGAMGMMMAFMPAGMGASGDVAVTLISPSLIFEELDVQKGKDISQKPPIVPSPLK